MSLTDLWANSREQLEGKHINQVIGFAGDGRLRDGNVTCIEFRDFLSHIPSVLLEQYATECLDTPFADSGFVLQDIINQAGRRLEFEVVDGRYRGITGQVGFDGIWKIPEGNRVVVEVKTTDAYRIDLNTIAGYRQTLINSLDLSEDSSSILIVVGREDTGDLEAQIRGSRHAWDIRLISVEALMRLMHLKEEIEDPQIVSRIHRILVPREFTKLDEIIDVVFSTAEDVRKEEAEEEENEREVDRPPRIEPESFHNACITRLELHLRSSLIKRSRAKYASPDGKLGLICAVSKSYTKGQQTSHWFAFHPYQRDFLELFQTRYVAFGCGNERTILLIPSSEFVNWLDGMDITQKANRMYWHVRIFEERGKILLRRKQSVAQIDLTKYLVPD